MKLQDQVCTLEQAKQLDSLGVRPNEGFLFAYYEVSVGAGFTTDLSHYHPEGYANIGIAPAFTDAELGVMLPWQTLNGAKPYSYDSSIATIGHGPIGFVLIDRNADGDAPLINPDEDDWAPSTHSTEAEARAALLIHLLETGKVTAEEVNARLAA